MLTTIALLAALLAPDAGASAPRVEAWVGHQVLKGKRKIPLFGEKETHTENFFLAEARFVGQKIQIQQKLCRIEIQPVGSVTASMTPVTVGRLPRSQFTVEVHGEGKLSATPWSHGWDDEDVDADGAPGATVNISGSSCTGEVYASNQSTTTLTAGQLTGDGMEGRISVTLRQRILGANGFCLRLIAGDSQEIQTGSFAYRKVPLGTTCKSLQGKAWPIKAAGAK
jgi:hypothetical protein